MEGDDIDLAGLRIHFDLAQIRPGGVGEVARIVERGFLKPRFQRLQRVVVRHIGREGDLAEAERLVGAGNRETAIREGDVVLGGLQHVRRDLLALGDDLVDGVAHRRSADCQRPRTIGSHAEGDLRRVAVDDFHGAGRNAQFVGNHLRKHGFMALTMAVRAGHHADVARGVDPHGGGVIKPDPRAQNAHKVRRREAAGFYPGGQAEAAQLAARGAVGAARLEPGDIADLQRLVQRGGVIARVIDQPDRRGVGIHVRGDEVLAPHLDRVQPAFAAHLVDHALQRIGRLGPASTPVGIDGRGVGEHGFQVHIDIGHLVGPGHQRAVQEGRRGGREVRQVSADIGQGFGAEGDEIALVIRGQFDLGDVIAAVGVGQEAFGALGGPADRAPDRLGGDQHDRFFAVVINLGSEPAAHIRGNDGQLVFRDAQHEGRNQQPVQMRVLAGGGQAVVAGAGVVFGNAGARLHRVGHQPVVDQFQRGDMRRGFDRLIDGGAVVLDPAPVEAQVVGDFVMHAVRRIGHRGGHIDDRRQILDHRVGGQLFNRVLRLFRRIGDDGTIGIADMAHLAMGQNRALGFAHRRAVAAVDQPARRVAADLDEILTGEHGQNAWHGQRRGGVDGHDAPMRHGRAGEGRESLAVNADVVGIGAASCQEP